MLTKALYLVGPPGVGKTTLMAEIAHQLGSRNRAQLERPVPHVAHEPSGWVELGRDRDAFSGTDALGYAVPPRAVEWVESDERPPLLMGEGDRLATDRFLAALDDRYDVFVLVELTGRDLAWQRAQARAIRLGRKPQNESWWRGRATKADRLGRQFDALRLDAARPAADLAAQVVAALENPAPV